MKTIHAWRAHCRSVWDQTWIRVRDIVPLVETRLAPCEWPWPDRVAFHADRRLVPMRELVRGRAAHA
jgi:hypothetical protein